MSGRKIFPEPADDCIISEELLPVGFGGPNGLPDRPEMQLSPDHSDVGARQKMHALLTQRGDAEPDEALRGIADARYGI